MYSVCDVLTFLVPSFLGKYLSKRQWVLSEELESFTNRVKNIFSGYDVIHSFNMMSHINKSFVMYNESLSRRKYETDRFITPLMSIMNNLSLMKSMKPILKKLGSLSGEKICSYGRKRLRQDHPDKTSFRLLH